MPRFSASASLLLRAAVGAGLVGAAILLVAGQDGPSAHLPDGIDASMAIEHRTRATPELGVSNLRSTARVAVTNPDEETIAVSIPEGWARAEVTGVALKDVTQDPPAFGFVRWTLPSGGTMTFDVPARIDHVELYNPSGIPLHLILRRTDILTGEADEETILIQESPSTLF